MASSTKNGLETIRLAAKQVTTGVENNLYLQTRNLGQLVTESFDAIVQTNPSAEVEVFTYKLGGTGGTTVATVTVTYTDSTKETLSTVVKT